MKSRSLTLINEICSLKNLSFVKFTLNFTSTEFLLNKQLEEDTTS